MVQVNALSERRVSFDNDTVCFAVFHDRSLLTKGMELDPKSGQRASKSCVTVGGDIATWRSPRITSIWFTLGASRPASWISLRWCTPLAHRRFVRGAPWRAAFPNLLVRDSDVPNLPFISLLDKRLPRLKSLAFSRQRVVNKEEIQAACRCRYTCLSGPEINRLALTPPHQG